MYEGVEPLTDASPDADARQRVTALFEAHALGLVKLAKVMLGDQSIAEDVVQDAFVGMYRKWASLHDRDKALGYLRASVLNALPHRAPQPGPAATVRSSSRPTPAASSPRRRAPWSARPTARLLAALRALPARQREAVVLRHYLGLTEEEAAQVMKVTKGTVKSATSRGLSTLARTLREEAE